MLLQHCRLPQEPVLSITHCCALQATHNLANLAKGMVRLRAFVHLSSAYVNCDQPRGSHVEERLYPMDWGRSSRTGEAHTVESLAVELRSLPAEAASRQVCQRVPERLGWQHFCSYP